MDLSKSLVTSRIGGDSEWPGDHSPGLVSWSDRLPRPQGDDCPVSNVQVSLADSLRKPSVCSQELTPEAAVLHTYIGYPDRLVWLPCFHVRMLQWDRAVVSSSPATTSVDRFKGQHSG